MSTPVIDGFSALHGPPVRQMTTSRSDGMLAEGGGGSSANLLRGNPTGGGSSFGENRVDGSQMCCDTTTSSLSTSDNTSKIQDVNVSDSSSSIGRKGMDEDDKICPYTKSDSREQSRSLNNDNKRQKRTVLDSNTSLDRIPSSIYNSSSGLFYASDPEIPTVLGERAIAVVLASIRVSIDTSYQLSHTVY